MKANSFIKNVADLKGKKIAFQVGSNAQYLLAKALREVGKITPAIIAEQQGVADFYFEEKIIPLKIDIKQGILAPLLYQAIIPDNMK